MINKVTKTDEQWRKELSPEAYEVLRRQGTEPAFSGPYDQTTEPGLYRCAGCGNELFLSDSKYDAGCGWPSFVAPADQSHVELEADNRYGMERVEVRCSRCGGHLGHVFDDGPGPTGKRYCINSVALTLDPKK
ncbi:MAG: peptide-methionine (R)-S-oxide reductase [Candidatus Buchananbacteria bacterium RIFCSPHIGHO2_02_FULL_56_16]|uniref:Peptide methionine sulfoxide reductase MsrB n=1 Tax=Candidatus Buchananbacteria bacterium RIFCSPHIGHO2_02_FULL_56_16 TaxID=1797542 RepID=A0A1G1YKY5_9BACT|nr:MAG: peptide-methionine (R)-S-oxide reductase [Candidatus Buchananbacteria bacterium RIFCSPHIGHO2_02_FULL_56_16]